MVLELQKEVIRVTNPQGHILYGILTRPHKKNDSKQLIISCQSGVVAKGEIGDHLRWVADRLAEQGITVIRFDQHGTGDSQGECDQDVPIRLFFQKIQDGCFKDDTLMVIDWAIQRFPGYDIFFLGECGGCISALAAAAERIKNVQGFILIAMPVLRFSDEIRGPLKIGNHDAKNTGKQYFQKLINPKSWGRLVRGKSDLKLIFDSIAVLCVNSFRSVCIKNLFQGPFAPDNPSFNQLFWDNLQLIAREKIPTCFLLPELDNETFEFNVEFKQKILNRQKKRYSTCEVIYLPATDHSIMFLESRMAVVNSILNWIYRG
ncbi:MAG: alpha/beta hydrolase [Deltaproteobacteria bacterium]|nr:alpha/beta hydrolase [Deltaproteobacteria bacterium]